MSPPVGTQQRSASPPPVQRYEDEEDPAHYEEEDGATYTHSRDIADQDISMRAKICYTFLAFFAYWFGASRFDMDGDGDFDAADMQHIINNTGKHMHLSFSRPVVSKKERRKRRRELEAKQRKEREERASRQERRGSLGSGGGITGAVNTLIDGAHDLVQVTVQGAEVQEQCEEEEITRNLRQYLPWFIIVEILLCIGLWAGYAAQEIPYELLSFNVAVNEALAHHFVIRPCTPRPFSTS